METVPVEARDRSHDPWFTGLVKTLMRKSMCQIAVSATKAL